VQCKYEHRLEFSDAFCLLNDSNVDSKTKKEKYPFLNVRCRRTRKNRIQSNSSRKDDYMCDIACEI